MGPAKKLAKASLAPLSAFGDMLGFGETPGMPEAPPPPPTIDDARDKQSALDRARRRRGRAAGLYTSPTGVGSSPVGKQQLAGV
jgi:hypothetical protein